jgi:hypothetical protein
MKTLILFLTISTWSYDCSSQTNPYFIKNKENAYVQLRNSEYIPQESIFVCKQKISDSDKEKIALALSQKKGIYDLVFDNDNYSFKILHLSFQNNTLILIHLREIDLQFTPVSTKNLEKIE